VEYANTKRWLGEGHAIPWLGRITGVADQGNYRINRLEMTGFQITANKQI
jgi:hypothetical protein